MFESKKKKIKMSIALGKNHEYNTAHGVYMAAYMENITSIIPQEKYSMHNENF